MRTLALLSVLQSMTTGAYIASCVEARPSAVEWVFAISLAIMSAVFACYVAVERGGR
ncbi:hypothetical protein [Rhodomicrobium sp.]|uniref:hypothetical protein n=1 Tax=Rhodomicrobium sp. TaxID=2720632 RepID=UPI0039E30CC4